MTLGEKWKQSIDNYNKEEIYFILTPLVEEAISSNKKEIWFNRSFNKTCTVEKIESYLEEFASKNGLILEAHSTTGWCLRPPE